MMTEHQKSKASELRAVVAATMDTAAGTPREAREDAVALARNVAASGGTAQELAVALGVHPTTLSRWKRESAAPRAVAPRAQRASTPSFREVRVEPASPVARRPAAPVPRALRVAHAPSGLVIDGLDVESLAALLRCLA